MLKLSYEKTTGRVTGVYGGNAAAPLPWVWVQEDVYKALAGNILYLKNGNLEAVPDTEKVLAEYDAAMETHIYNVRAARGYTTREPGVYINSIVPRWKADAEVWNAWLDAVMQYSLNILNKAKETGDIPSLKEYINNAPGIVWPEVN